jgi:hypothetical protein
LGFQEEFFKVLPKALSFVQKQGDDKIKKQAGRLVNVWEERRVFGTKHIKSFREVIGGGSSGGGAGIKAAAGSGGAAAAGPSSAAAAAAAADLGPVGEALTRVSSCSAAAAARSKDFNSSWSQVRLNWTLYDQRACSSLCRFWRRKWGVILRRCCYNSSRLPVVCLT